MNELCNLSNLLRRASNNNCAHISLHISVFPRNESVFRNEKFNVLVRFIDCPGLFRIVKNLYDCFYLINSFSI